MRSILFLEHLPYIAGGQRVLLDIVEGLKEYYNIQVVLPAKGPFSSELENIGISYHVIPIGEYKRTHKSITDVIKYPILSLKFARNLSLLIKRHKINLVYANGALTFLGGVLACYFSQTPVILHLHSVWSDAKALESVRFLSQLNIVKRVICVSHVVKNQLLKSNKNIVIYNAVNLDNFKPCKSFKIYDELGIPHNYRLIGIVSSLIPEKGHETFIRAAKIVANQFPHLIFLIIGDIPDESERNYKEHLHDLVNNLKLNDKLIFTGYRTDIPYVMQTLDTLVVASAVPEACPMVIAEASASETPVVASRLGGNIELVENYVNGFLYEPSNYEDLAEKNLMILQDDALANKLGKQSRTIAEEKFDKRKFVQRIKREIDLVSRYNKPL